MKCHVDKASDEFRMNARNSARRRDCRECERAASLAHARAHAEDRRIYARAYGKAHAEERNEYRRRRIAANGPPVRTPEQQDRRRERQRARLLVAPEPRRAAWHRYRARLLAAVVEHVDVQRVIARDDSTCYLCHRRLTRREVTLDHVVPLTRGGAHSEANLRVACRSCNCRKGAKLLEEMAG